MTDVETLYQGMTALFDVFDVPIVGGDTTAWTAGLVIDVALIGQPFADVHPVTRSGAKPGDTLYVTGPLGGSLRGSHLDFTPRVREAEQLARAWKSDLHAMIDITDGLALDLHRLCEASGLGAELDESAVQAVISDDAKALAAEGDRTPLDHALSDGEDFELLIAADASADPKKCHGVSLLPIGRVTAASVTMRHTDGATRPLLKTGYDHLA
jgi:thiamine-monophosphate kinase